MIKSKEQIEKEFDEKFPKNTVCGESWGCDNCGACYDSCIKMEDAKAFINQIREQDRKDLIKDIVAEIESKLDKEFPELVKMSDGRTYRNVCDKERIKELLSKYV